MGPKGPNPHRLVALEAAMRSVMKFSNNGGLLTMPKVDIEKFVQLGSPKSPEELARRTGHLVPMRGTPIAQKQGFQLTFRGL